MKELYGKTTLNPRSPGYSNGLFRHVRPVLYDVRNLMFALRKRPAVIPAALMLVCVFSCFYSVSVIPSVVLCVITMAACVYFAFAGDHNPVNVVTAILTGLMICGTLLYDGFFISSRLKARAGSDRIGCVVTGVSYDLSGGTGLTVRLDGGALAKVTFRCDHGDFCPGDELMLKGRLKEPDKPGNPGEFDYREYLRKQGILYVFSCDGYIIARKARFPLNVTGALQRMFFGLRKKAFEAVTASFEEPYGSLTAAVCLGDRSLISKTVSRDFAMSCCSHLLAVSGTHFSGFLVCLPVVLSIAGIKRKNMFAVHVIFCILIGCLTGWSDSVTRAAVMSICVYADREWMSALSLAAVIMLTADPFCALSSGFQMSFCAVIAIKVYGKRITDMLMKLHFGEGTAKMISAAVSATLGLIPFWSDIAMRPDPEHLAVQVAGSVIAGAACTFFVPCVLMCSLFPLLSSYLSTPLFICLKVLYAIVSAGSGLSARSGAPVRPGRMLLILLAITVFLCLMPPCMLKRVFFKPVAVILAVAVGAGSLPLLKRPDCLVVFADVGQGDCCLIITPDRTCMIDGGTYMEGGSTVSDLLDHYGIGRVDLCVMSHWDADHAGGIAALCGSGRTETILTSYVPDADDRDKDVMEFFKSGSVNELEKEQYLSRLKPVFAGDRIDLSDKVYLEVLYPSVPEGGGNESSLVVMLHILGKKETSILFTGDIGTKTEELLLEQRTDLDCDILKVAHHGSKYSSSEEFIAACSPDIAVISVGANNFYGHPAPATLERLGSYGCSVFRTDTEGAVVLEY